MKTHRRSDPAANSQQTAEASLSAGSTEATQSMDSASQAYALQASYGNQYVAELARAQGADEGAGAAEADPLTKATPVKSLPGVTANDHSNFEVAERSDIERRSEAHRAGYGDTFGHMNEDYLLGFTLDDGAVHMGYEGDTQRRTEAAHLTACDGIDTLGEYRQMVVRDFNFSGVYAKYTKINNAFPKPSIAARDAGMTGFVADVVARFYPDNKVGDPEVETCVAIARNVWSYATTGMDLNNNTDIAQMQGLLFVFDKEIRGSSNTNTKMKSGEKAEHWFVVPGTEDWDTPIKLLKGDGRHGRATILTTRHLLAGMSETPPETELTGYDESYMLIDRSGSMQVDEFTRLASLIDAGGIEGDLHLAGFNDDSSTLMKVRSGQPLTQDEAREILKIAGDEASALRRKEIGGYDKADPALTDLKKGQATQEEGMAAALKWAEELPASDGARRQMVVVTDETDFNPNAFTKLQEVARAKNLSVKVLYSDNSRTPGVGDSGSDRYVVIDLLSFGAIKSDWLVDREGKKQLNWELVALDKKIEFQSW